MFTRKDSPLHSRTVRRGFAVHAYVALAFVTSLLGCAPRQPSSDPSAPTGFGVSSDMSPQTLAAGRQIFRFETFGDEQFWTDTARMHEVVQKGVSPTTALSVGLKVDADAIPADVAQAIKDGKVDLNSPATTVTLLKLNAVVGLKGTVETVNGRDTLVRLGVTCALLSLYGEQLFRKGHRQPTRRLAQCRSQRRRDYRPVPRDHPCSEGSL